MDDPAIISAGRGSERGMLLSTHVSATAHTSQVQAQSTSRNLHDRGQQLGNAFEARILGMIQSHSHPQSDLNDDLTLKGGEGSVPTDSPQQPSPAGSPHPLGDVEARLPRQHHNTPSLLVGTDGQGLLNQRTIAPPQGGDLPEQHTTDRSLTNQPPPGPNAKSGNPSLPRATGTGVAMPTSAQSSNEKPQSFGDQPDRGSRAHSRPNQKQRRQGASSIQHFDRASDSKRESPNLSQYYPQQTTQTRQIPQYDTRYQAPSQPPHVQATQQYSPLPSSFSWNHAPSSHWHNRNVTLAPRSRAYSPAVWPAHAQPHQQYFPPHQSKYQQRHLFDPHSDRRPNHSQGGEWTIPAALTNQSHFLDQLASSEVPKAQIGYEELKEKQMLRLKLEQICQGTILEFELLRNPDFDSSTISLECFGSLGSGFAMAGSDMDLALLSPLSHPAPASAESEIPRLLEKRLLDLGYGARLLTRTRVPIIRFCEKPTPALTDAMREARSKWEKEKEEPSKPKMSKGEKKVNAVTPIANDTVKVVDADASDKALGQEPGSPRTVDSIDELSASLETLKIKEPQATSNGEANKAVLGETTNGRQEAPGLQVFKSRTDDELVRLYGLALKEGWFDLNERIVIINFIRAVKLCGADADHQDLKQARDQLNGLPDVLSRYREPHVNPLDLPKSGVGIQCDINFSNQLAIQNTTLLRCYTLCDPRVTPVVIFVKAWTKRRKINSPYHGTLSSYGYVLMVLHYLINIVRPPIVPNLQSGPYQGDGLVVDGYDVRFWRDEHEIQRLAAVGELTQNRSDTVGSLLRGFFKYYAHPSDGGFQWNSDVLSLRTPGGLLRKEDKGWTGAKTVTVESNVPGEDAKEVRHRYLFAIEDPFEIDHNIARTVVHNGIVAIRDEFRRAHRIVQAHSRNFVTIREELLTEAESKEHLQYRYFGPIIPDFGKKKASTEASGGQDATRDNVNEEAQTSANAQAAEEIRAAVTSDAEILANSVGDVDKPSQTPTSDQIGLETDDEAAGSAVVSTEHE